LSSITTAAEFLRDLVDPSAVGVMGLSTRHDEIVQVLDHHAVPVFDNVSGIQQWQADLLCKAVTGGGFSRRELYSDDSDVIFNFQRAIIITGINVSTAAPDLLERCLLVYLDRIKRKRRREASKLRMEFYEARPRILGALLDIYAKAIKIHAKLKPHWVCPRSVDTSYAASRSNSIGLR
jgi:hypothetical protein